MRILKEREFIAIPIVLVIVGIFFVLFAAADAGLWAWLLVGAVGIVLGALLVWSISRRRRHPAARDAPHVATSPNRVSSVQRVLVIADVACAPAELQTAIGDHAAGRAVEAFVVAPAAGSRLGRWTGDQHGYDDATEHLNATLAALGDIGIDARGRIGSHDPIQAADDGLREFPAEEIVFAVHSENTAGWLEKDALAVARERYELPVTPIVVGGP